MKIIYEKEKCIGCGTCAALCPKYFEMGNDDKSNLKSANTSSKTKKQELVVEQAECIEEAAESCPVQIIHIIRT